MNLGRPLLIAVLVMMLTFGGGAVHYDEMPEEWRHPKELPHPSLRSGAAPPEGEYLLADGFRLELVVDGLTYPTMVTWDAEGRLYVAESGYAYGPSTAIPRILAVDGDDAKREVARLPDGPVTSIGFHDDLLYAIGGRDPARIWTIDPDNGNVTTLLTGFPVWGRHFTSDLAFDDDRVYFAVGDPTNSGVLGLDDYYTYGYLSIFPGARSIPCVTLHLRGGDFETPNPYHPDPDEKTFTGPYHRFGERAQEDERIPAGSPPGCNGAVFRAQTDGSDLEVYATGLRHVHGLGFTPDGRLLAVEEGMRAEGSRPIANTCDALWHIEQDAWYGFPDYACGRPITEQRFVPENRSAPRSILKDHPPFAGPPLHAFAGNSGTRHFDIAPDDRFGPAGALFVAQAGSHFEYPPKGHRILQIDLEGGNETVVYQNRIIGPEGRAPERPHAVRFGPDGALYLVDHGKLMTTTKTFHPSALTGAIWRIIPDTADGPLDEEASP